MLQFTTLYSGSAGNSTLITASGGALLVDMGGSCRRTLKSLYEHGVSAHDLMGILITHEHSDHIGGLRVFLKNYDVPIFGSKLTLNEIKYSSILPDNARAYPVEPGFPFDIAGMTVQAFRTSHDSSDCFGYRVAVNGVEMAIATDIGCITDEAWNGIKGCKLVALESNYDDEMLRTGKYPYYLKNRIMSKFGHLSNNDCARVAVRLAQNGTSYMVLMHLSQENNLPALALTSCLAALEDNGLSDRMSVQVAPRDCAGRTIEI